MGLFQSPEANGNGNGVADDDDDEPKRHNGHFYHHDDEDADLFKSQLNRDSKYTTYGLGSKSFESEPPKKYSFASTNFDLDSTSLEPPRRPYR